MSGSGVETSHARAPGASAQAQGERANVGVEHWAEARPDEIALIEDDRSLTWRQLNILSDAVAEALSQQGVAAGDVVAVRTHIRIEWAIIDLALSKIGCRLLGLNWRLTPGEVAGIISDSGARALFFDDSDPAPLLDAVVSIPSLTLVGIDYSGDKASTLSDMLDIAAPTRIAKAPAPLVIYTSGTTGRPRGVVIAPRPGAEQAFAEYQADVAQHGAQVAGDVVLVTMPMSHAIGPAIVRAAEALGNRMIILRRFDPEEVLRLIDAYRVSFWTGVPTMFKRLAALPAEAFVDRDLSSIRVLSVGGAPTTTSLKQWINATFGPCLYEGYGASEVGMVTALPPGMDSDRPGSCGRPFRHVEISVRGTDGSPLAPGEIGEIWVRSPLAINGYLNAPPLSPEDLDVEGFFRVGDVGRIDEQGYLYLVDRSKDLIVAGGVNIYPAEVEAALLKHPAIQDAAVIGIPDDDFGERVKAFCEVKPSHSVDEAEILQHCRRHLASYKCPRSVEIIDELPRNAMGKVLKRNLRQPYWEGQERSI
ncbi:class I adenylate-forming enzyme family protein [Nocardia sp. SC052]|uniref:class I adenylate-forming enzyme family protein n=1 Tax=Nocardia sichangensis TaxID=3385975 RepID=UPI0039A0EA98